MDDDQKCKNLLCERTCDKCINEEEDFTILKTIEFPFSIPEMYKLLLVERKRDNIIMSITAFIKNNKILIRGEDWSRDSKYSLHFRYPKCIITQEIIPPEMTCKQFKSN